MNTAKEKLSPARAMERARGHLIMRQPFFAHLAMRFPWIETREIPTAATDGCRYYYNPDYVAQLPRSELAFLIAHEVMHNVLFHCSRICSRGLDPQLGNMAADYVVNPTLHQALGNDRSITMPHGALYDERFVGWTFEAIYRYLRDNPQQQSKGNGGTTVDRAGHDHGQQGCGGATGNPAQRQGAADKASRAAVDATMKAAICEAARVAKSQGKLPGSIAGLIEEITRPQVDCWEYIRHFVSSRAAEDYSWRRGNRRFLGRDLYLPSMYSETIGTIAVGVDTSGSVSNRELEIIAGNLSMIMEDYAPERVIVYQCDSAISSRTEYTREDMPLRTFRVTGRGGTRVAPVFDAIAQEGLEPDCLIYFSDMMVAGTFPDHAPEYPVLWGATDAQSTGKLALPFGEEIDISQSLAR